MDTIVQFHGPRIQRGASFLPTMMIMALIGLMLVAILKVAPTYMDNNTIMNTVEGVINNNDMANTTVGEVRTQVMRTLNINGIDFNSGSIIYVSENGVDYIDVNYESRVSLFYNIDAVVSFQNRLDRVP